MSDINKKYEAVEAEISEIAELVSTKTRSLTAEEKTKLSAGAMLWTGTKMFAHVAALEEGLRRSTSTAFKDRFHRAINIGYVFVSADDKSVQKVARAQALAQYEETVATAKNAQAVFAAPADDTEAKALARQEKILAEQFLAALRNVNIDRDITVRKPLSLTKRAPQGVKR